MLKADVTDASFYVIYAYIFLISIMDYMMCTYYMHIYILDLHETVYDLEDNKRKASFLSYTANA